MIEVSGKLGQTPMWVMKSFTYPQLFLFYSKMKKTEFDFAELQARLVWAIINGWKKPKQLTAENVDQLKNSPMFQEEKK